MRKLIASSASMEGTLKMAERFFYSAVQSGGDEMRGQLVSTHTGRALPVRIVKKGNRYRLEWI
jgi:hypothetical protein